MAAALRSVRRLQQVLLLPRISVTSVRAESGGKGSPHTEIGKTLVSFPVRVSHFQQTATGENRNEPLRPVKAPLLDVGESDGQSGEAMYLGQEVSCGQNVDETSHKEDSSSSSDSSSDSESEEKDNRLVTDLHTNKGEIDGGHQVLSSAVEKSSFSPGHRGLEKESPVAQEENNGTGIKGENAENLQDAASVVTTEEQSLHTAPPPTKMTPLGADRMETPDRTVSPKEASSTTAINSEIKVLSTSEELPAIGVETSAPESAETHILLITTSKDFPTGGVETSAPESAETQALSTAPSEDRSAEEEVAQQHESYSPPEPCADPKGPFDNTKYQNLQHFTYTPFTFVDLDVELAKYRLPQPSSGRPSPRH